MSGESDSDQSESELGRKDYWDRLYQEDMANYESYGDSGQAWFGSKLTRDIVSWIVSESGCSHSEPVLDLGCGNGHLLVALAHAGFMDLTGVDYSTSALELAQSVAQRERVLGCRFEQVDITCPPNESKAMGRQYALCVDKGTYDAIGLSESGKAAQEAYKSVVERLILPGGYLLLASCNWTRAELLKDFGVQFELVHVIPTPVLQYGGKTGANVTALILKRKSDDHDED